MFGRGTFEHDAQTPTGALGARRIALPRLLLALAAAADLFPSLAQAAVVTYQGQQVLAYKVNTDGPGEFLASSPERSRDWPSLCVGALTPG